MKRPKISEPIPPLTNSRHFALAATATKHDLYIALFLIVRDCLSANRREHPGIQRLNALASLILSAEFLPGLHPANNLLNFSTTESTQ